MVCSLFYYAVQEGANCIGESCEKCYPIFHGWLLFILVIFVCFLVLLIVLIFLVRRAERKWQEGEMEMMGACAERKDAG